MTRIVLLLFQDPVCTFCGAKRQKPAGVILIQISGLIMMMLVLLPCCMLLDSDYISILATMAVINMKALRQRFNVFNTYFGRPGIPIGVLKGNAVDVRDFQHWTDG